MAFGLSAWQPLLALDVRLSAETIVYHEMVAQKANVTLQSGTLNLSVQNLRFEADSDFELKNAVLSCAVVEWEATEPCSDLSWAATVKGVDDSWALPLSGLAGKLLFEDSGQTLETSVESGAFSARATARLADDMGATVTWAQQELKEIPAQSLLPEAFGWIRDGHSSGVLEFRLPPDGPLNMDFDFKVDNLAFDSPEGRFAGEGLQIGGKGSVRIDDGIRLETDASISSGALLLGDFYTEFSDYELQWRTALTMNGSRVAIEGLRVSDGGSLELVADARFDLDQPLESLDYEVDHFELQFPLAYSRFAEAMASAWTLDGLAVTGSLVWSGQRASGKADSGVLDIVDLSIVDTRRGRFAITGLDAHIEPKKAGAPDLGVDSHFSWRGFLIHQINLGGGAANVQAAPGRFSLASPLELNILGGTFKLDELRVRYPGGATGAETEPEIRLQASLEDMDMARLTQALDWPPFDGTISGTIPGVTWDGGVLEVEGGIEFDVFDGQVLLSDLRVERPFGVLPSLAANLEVENLDLQQLTHTFSFGQISGRMSGFVHDLRMLDWEPVAFDAWFGTPLEEKGSNQISRQAVNRLTNIGGGGATAALTGPVMRLFSNFSYRRLGLGCRLENNTCHVRGLDDDDSSVLIMEGAGIPKIMIRAYNRSMDWPTLVSGLMAASQGESIQIGD